ncbi:MAG: FAD-dependent pyridine nucleotide-disulfide oxidoreductase [Candidatus Uhrbacteria bacterium GW2011_GWE2_40_58]|nr:MAG: FAD-dependent pyridine nucleotide-disulfide oxidoreductase [Candidatus Uhrbacteria bacterium GW2011_GWF2_40_263]KKR67756.1 MAG: FAD-dependent pyridine nucleotide-disulfide oxidoreductase [Candidatus Uhrbacteria bacterium GW2011_GWE2_40_58]OGL92196.1 MAG: hypothetical protein A2239_03010 [Candidatus Uhrbacteria bacterium RIFOXYA2_FULL_40_9]OGL96731.1 MAG: hypothetical protein A2332_00430 [Candidatus Uhrbacteria bacterium RIFOXYB2_FULL_41_18]
MRYVIVGAGIAGTTAAEELRKLDPTSDIILLSEEQHPVYSRVLLASYLMGKTSREKLFLKKESWYEDQKIEWIRGVVVDVLDSVNKFVRISDGREIPYDKLLLTTGCQPHLLEEDVRGIIYLRTLDDADHLLQLFSEQGKEAKGIIYGGGFIASEYLNTFAHYHIPTTIAFRGPYFWSRVLDKASGELINQHLFEKQVTVVPDVEVEKILGDKQFEAVKTTKGIFSGTLLAVGIGTDPELSLFKQINFKTGKGVRVNASMQTSQADIFAAGDVAEFEDVIVGRPLVARTWMNAVLQARVAAKNMAGGTETFHSVSSYAMNILGLEVIFVGDTSREHAEEIVLRGSKKERGITQLFIRKNKLVGATIVNRTIDRVPIMKLIQEQKDVHELKKNWEDTTQSFEG